MAELNMLNTVINNVIGILDKEASIAVDARTVSDDNLNKLNEILGVALDGIITIITPET